jgi:transposase
VDARELAGLELAARANVEWTGKFWFVPSSTGGNYRVSADATDCTCEDFELTGQPCKHMIAVRHHRAHNRGGPEPVSPTAGTDTPQSVRPTYRQPWAKYNAAQTSEKRHFKHLLADLCGTVEQPPRKGGSKGGRPPIPLRDALFAAVFKVYSTVSGRRFTCDLQDALHEGHVAHAPHYNSVFRVLEDEATTPVLHDLIGRSSLPLTAVEQDFAIDSSGFGSSRFVKWFDTKHGTERRQADWVKAHLCVGVRTQIVTAVRLGNEHDGQHFPALVEATAEHFRLRDVSADKAYLSLKNVELVAEYCGVPYIPPKRGSNPDRDGEAWRRMFHLFALNRTEFLKHYHQRSNVESAFSMMKRKFGDSIRSRTPVAMANESLAKVLAHNLVVLVHEMHELNISPEFGGRRDEPEQGDSPRIIRFPLG